MDPHPDLLRVSEGVEERLDSDRAASFPSSRIVHQAPVPWSERKLSRFFILFDADGGIQPERLGFRLAAFRELTSATFESAAPGRL